MSISFDIGWAASINTQSVSESHLSKSAHPGALWSAPDGSSALKSEQHEIRIRSVSQDWRELSYFFTFFLSQ